MEVLFQLYGYRLLKKTGQAYHWYYKTIFFDMQEKNAVIRQKILSEQGKTPCNRVSIQGEAQVGGWGGGFEQQIHTLGGVAVNGAEIAGGAV